MRTRVDLPPHLSAFTHRLLSPPSLNDFHPVPKPMDAAARCQELAERLHTLLLEQVGMGLDAQRMREEPLYARDVLLVCAAHPGSELAALAWAYRDAAAGTRPKGSAEARPGAGKPAASVDPQVSRPVGPHDGKRGNGHENPNEARTGSRKDTPLHVEPHEEADSQPPSTTAGSPLSRFSPLSLTRFGASIFGGSLFDRSLFSKPQADPVTDFGDDSYLDPVPAASQRPQAGGRAKPSPPRTAPRWARWFSR